MTLQIRPGADAVAAVFPPWWSDAQALSAAASADAAIVRTGGLATILVVKPSPDDGLERLHRAGALLTIDPRAIGACLEIR